ncbi:MAG: hypothetical protein JWM33_2503 [Caulobacteraceae bacterium]|nr:hypothetical protein [Caulobacteraceae bacterium]
MFSVSSILGRGRLPVSRIDFAAQRCADQPQAARPPSRQRAADDRLYFAIRSFGANGPQHILQYAFADDRGNVVLSAFSQNESLAGRGHEPAEEMSVPPLRPETLDELLGRVCGGANLVAFGRVLQAGLLPDGMAGAAASVDCAWRRFLKISRQQRIPFDRHEPLTLSDALGAAGLGPLDSTDAAMRALAIRRLWIWMDEVELNGRWL